FNGQEQITSQHLKLPDSLAMGLSWSYADLFSINIDVIRTFYSQSNSRFYNAFFDERLLAVSPSNRFFAKGFQESSLTVQDRTEYRIGGEHTIVIGKYPLTLRAGYWREPFHNILQRKRDADLEEFRDSAGNLTGDVLSTPATSKSLEQDNNHLTFGAGIV